MQVMILNSGLARRLQPLTDTTHKSLLPLNGLSILERQIQTLYDVGLNEFIITTGPFADQIERLVSEKFPRLQVAYINNPKYDKTNYIYSMWLARHEVAEDLLLLHGDLVFTPEIIQKILPCKESSVIIDSEAPLPEKDFKGRLRDGKVVEIGINIFGKDAVFLLPLYFWQLEDFTRWMEQVDEYIKAENWNVYAENAFNDISNEIPLTPIDIAGDFCMEIDTAADLREAEEKIKKIELNRVKSDAD